MKDAALINMLANALKLTKNDAERLSAFRYGDQANVTLALKAYERWLKNELTSPS